MWLPAAALALGGSAPADADELCSKLKNFETAPLPSNPERARWIEVHWVGSWLSEDGWGLNCVGSDEIAQALCRYVVGHTSYEFPSYFPARILSCKGFDLPRMRNWQAEIDVNMAEDRWHRLVVDLGERENDSGAVRYISVSDQTAGGNDIEFLPIAPLTGDTQAND